MIYSSRTKHTRTPGGFLSFSSGDRSTMFGFGEGDSIRLRDEFGNLWVGSATREDDNVVRYRFRDDHGHYLSGVSDSYGISLRDDKGKTWRGVLY
jgi:hypothetical protein